MISEGWPHQKEYIDIKDREGTWIVALVLLKNQNQIKVRIDGYSPRYDETLPIPTEFSKQNKIQPFRSHSRGYTGNKKSTAHRQHWKWSNQEMDGRLKKVEEFISKARSKRSEQVIQFVRGQHYLYIDFLLSLNYQLSHDLNNIYQYFQLHIQLTNVYIQDIISTGIDKWLQRLKPNPHSDQLQEKEGWERAYATCHFQIFQGLFDIAGLNERLGNFQKYNQKGIKKVVSQYQTHENYISNELVVSGTFDMIKILIVQVNLSKAQIPILFLYSLYELFLSIEKTLLLEKDPQLNILLQSLSEITRKSFTQLTAQDLKNNALEKEIDQLLFQICFIYGKHYRNQLIQGWFDQARIRYCVLTITTNTIQRKFKGLSKLKELCLQIISTQQVGNSKEKQLMGRLKKIKLQEILFEHNEHQQFFKKSLQCVSFMYQRGLIGIEALVYAWNHSINKQQSLVKSLYAFCLQMMALIRHEDIQTFLVFLDMVKKHYDENKVSCNSQAIEFYFRFVDSTVKYIHRKCQSLRCNMGLQKITKSLAQSLYQYLFSGRPIESDQLINSYSKTIMNTTHHQAFILQLFNDITHKDRCHLSISILFQVYCLMQIRNFFVPQKYVNIILNCLKTVELDLLQTKRLIKLFNRILLAVEQMSTKYQLKPEQFKQFWQLFQTMPQSKRILFYQWIMDSNKKYSDNTQINQVISLQLKKYVLMYVLKEQNFANFKELTKRQLQIIIQFYLDVNYSSSKLQLKNYSNEYKVYRLRQMQTIRESLLWSIFQKCQNTQVISILNQYLIPLHFYYVPQVSYSLRKGRVDEFITKIKGYLHSAFAIRNTQMIRHTLMLLKNVIELIKEERYSTDSSSETTIKLQISFQNKTSCVLVKYEDTIGNIKNKLASMRKLDPASIKIMNIKNEQLSYDVKDIPIYCFTEKYFKAVEIPKDEQTMTKFVSSLLSQSMEEVLFNILQIEETTQEVYYLLSELQFKQNRESILQRVNDIIGRQQEVELSTSKAIHYYYLIQLNIYLKNCDDHAFIQRALATPSFRQLLAMLPIPIIIEAHAHLLSALTNLLTYAFKYGIKFEHKQQLAEYCWDMLHQIYVFGQRQRLNNVSVGYLQKIAHNGTYLMEEVVTQGGMLFFIISKKKHRETLQLLYFSSSIEEIKMAMIQRIKKYLGMYKIQPLKNILIQETIFQLYANLFYKQIVSLFYSRQLRQSKGKAELFTTISKVLEVISSSTFEVYVTSAKQFSQQVIGFIQSVLHQKRLRYQQSVHLMVSGHLSLLKSIIQRRPQLKTVQTINFILRRCLNDQDITQPSICRHPLAIEISFQLVKTILQSNTKPQFFKCIMEAFKNCHKIMFWRISNKWSIKVHPQGTKMYRGLTNPGCICYMNSLLQQLFMIPQFKMGLLGLDTKWIEANESEQDCSKEYPYILQGMKELFFKLIYSDENVVNPVPFAKTIKNPQKKPLIKINQQMDIDEFQAILFEKLEKELDLLGSKNIIRQLFGGVYSNQIISSECNHRSQREESFISISLQVKKNIYESFRSFVKVDRLDGDNKYFCELCNKKVKAQKIQSIKKLPPYLIICLKRFQFNFQMQAKTKINDYCQFYEKLKLKEFSTQEISRDRMIEEQNESKQVYSDDFFNYKLRGVVIHTGSTDSGHYFSLIEDKAGNWVQFNDEDVYPFDITKLPEEAFGNKISSDDNRVRNAYLLIYERECLAATAARNNSQQVASNKQLKHAEEELFRLQQNRRMVSSILLKNSDLQKYSLVFSESYQQFIEFLTQKYEQLASQKNQSSVVEDWYEFYLSYYFLILVRKDSFDQFLCLSKYLEESVKKNRAMRHKYLKLFTSCHFIDQFFVSNPNKERCRIVGHLFATAFIAYIQDTLDVTLHLNQLFNLVLMVLKMMLIHHGQIYELTIALRRVLQFLAANHKPHLRYIIHHFSFQNIYLDFIFGNLILPKQKDQYAHMVAENKKLNIIPFIPPTFCTDKKFTLTEHVETWIVLSILIKEAAQMALSQEYAAIKANLTYLSAVVSSVPGPKNCGAINQSLNERGVSHLYQTYKYLKLSKKICEGLEGGFRDYDSLKYRPFMLLILAIVRDPSREIEIGTIISILFNAYKHNAIYFFEGDLIHQWIVRFMACSAQFLKQFYNRTQFIQSILSWIQKTPFPIGQTLKKNKISHTDKLLNRYYGILLSWDANDYKENLHLLKKVYESVLDFNFQLKGSIHRVDQPLTAGKEVKYFDTTSWKWIEHGCTVQSNSFGYVIVKVGKEKVYLWQDCEKVKVHNHQPEFQIQKEQNNSSLSYQDSDSQEQDQEQKQEQEQKL